MGWSEKEALLGKEKITVYDHEGNTFTSNREKSREHNVAESTYRTKIKAGYSEKEALNGLEKVKDPITGIYYKSYRALCEDIGLSYNTFKDRLKKGMTKEEAVSKNRSK